MHFFCPDGQVKAHFPAEQTWPVAHALSQPPQCLPSLFRLTQVLPHWVVPGPQIPLSGPASSLAGGASGTA